MESISLKITDQKNHFNEGIKVSNQFSAKDKQRLAKVSKDFESILTSMMIKSMTKSTEGLFGKNGYGGDVLDVLFETELSKFITETKGMGVAEQIYKNIVGEKFPTKTEHAANIYLNKKNITDKVEPKDLTKFENSKAMSRLKKYDHFIKQASAKYNVDERLIKSVILTESAGKEDAKSKANAKGLMQLMDSTATDMGVKNPWDPRQNIYGGTKYLAKMLNDFDGDTDLALAAYNAGPGNVKKYGGVPPFGETKFYISRVNNYLNILE